VRMRRTVPCVLACVLVASCAAIVFRGASPSRSSGQTLVSAPFRFFSASSVWNTQLSANEEIDASSPFVMQAFQEEIAAGEAAHRGPWINTTKYSVSLYTVPAHEQTVTVQLRGTSEPALARAWKAVPLPDDAQPSPGSDGDLFVWQPSSDRLWEFWRLKRTAGGWSARWGGAMRHVSADSGVYEPRVWPGAKDGWGVSASSMSLVGGLITLEDLQKGRINHALALAIPGVRGGVYASPAHRTDGYSSNPLALPEGAHLRLNPALNLASLHLPPVTLMIAEAAQQYGIYVTDGTGKSGVVQFSAQDPVGMSTDPYEGPGGYFGGQSPLQILSAFPWSQLELLQMELHTSKHERVP
jgi:hypothetical protein